MKNALQSLHSVAGVEGTLLCSMEGTVQASTCSGDFDKGALARIAYALTLGVRFAQSQGKMPRSIYGTFENGRVIVRPFEKGLIVVMGEKSIKQLLLKAALDQAIQKLTETKAIPEKQSDQKELQIAAGRVRVDQAALDNDLVTAWHKSNTGVSAVKQVELQTASGKIAMFKIKTKRKLGQTVEVNSSALKELGLAEGETVVARPVIRLTSEVEEFFG